ncbi:MAG: UDP-N-acetylglucosamine 4,6-dehydratase (inverting) [Pseudomonadota bacterium]
MFDQKSILITGGTGSFGQEFVSRLLSQYKPKRIVIYSRDELKQWEMSERFKSDILRFFIGDVRDCDRLKMALENVDYVVHAAALKQVPAAEYNPMECIKTNIMGANNVITACLDQHVKKIVALSTDKAASPINLYGASKLASDKLFIAANNLAGNKPIQFSVVRYGNVAGSRGSVLPYFSKIIKEGSDHLPITHTEMTRFWITLTEGVEFVIQSFYRMQGGEIFVPKLPSVKMTEVATAMAPELPIVEVGIRPGEKLHEIMCPRDSAHHTIEFDDHYVITPTIKVSRDSDYKKNTLGEIGHDVGIGFEYESGTNPDFLEVSEIRTFVQKAFPELGINSLHTIKPSNTSPWMH